MAASGVLCWYGVPLTQTARFAAYVGAGIVLPGTLLWRVLRGRPSYVALDIAAGTVLGYCLEVLAYILARWAGMPQAFLCCPVVVIGTCLAVPALRKRCRAARIRVPAWWAWAVAGFGGLPVAWGAAGFFRTHGIGWPGNATPYVDLPFVMAVVGEAKSHVPPTYPMVAGAPLDYHWFAFADIAAAGWATGIEIETLVCRLWPLPLMAAFAVLIAFIARRLSGSWWAGVVALVITYLVAAPNPVGWTSHLIPSGAVLDGTIWVSPSQTLGTVVFALVVFVLVELLRARGRVRVGTWFMLVLLLMTLAGAKATYLPLLLAGLVVVIGVEAAMRRVRRPVVAAAGTVAGCLGLAQIVLYQGTTKLLSFQPLAGVDKAIVQADLGHRTHSADLVWAMAASLLVSWAMIWAGTAGLVRRRRDSATWLLLGLGGAGACATLLLEHIGGAEFYFIQAARPYLAVAAACGFAAVVPAELGRGRRLALLTAAVVGILAVQAVAATNGDAIPQDDRAAVDVLGVSFFTLIGVVAACAGGVLLAARWFPTFRNMAPAVVLTLLVGLGLTTDVEQRALLTFEMWTLKGGARIPSGAPEAGRWLRDHSPPDSIVAVNIPCTPQTRTCYSRTFWASSYTERRVLVEGWAYTTRGNLLAERRHLNLDDVPFWDSRRLADNAAAFQTPSAETLGRLRDVYGVRWLIVNDLSSTKPAPTLQDFVIRRFHAGHCTVYEIPAMPGSPRAGV
ncbi:hypothetical protein [Nonomuraea sp. NPDC049695]|uniref:hypothetical protein n=1 Tax=Nonomuraea sp. NPDC049695 TaxID=3154734 RepID=UPI00343D80DF